MSFALHTAGWIACVVYATIPSFWLVIHPRAEYWRSRPHSPYLILVPAWMAMWVVVSILTAPWRHIQIYSTSWSWIPAAALFVSGFSIYRRAAKGFSTKQLGGIPELLPNHKEQRLVISGIRARVRHPVYLGHLCEMMAWSVGTGLAVCYGLTLFALLTGAIMIKLEDEELTKRFGPAYIAYRSQVPAVLPKLNS